MRPIVSSRTEPGGHLLDGRTARPRARERLRREVLAPDIGFCRARMAAIVAAGIVLLAGATDVLLQQSARRKAEAAAEQREQRACQRLDLSHATAPLHVEFAEPRSPR